MSILDTFLERVQRATFGARDWPPPELKDHWEKIAYFRQRYENDRDEMLAYASEFNTSNEKARTYTPVPLAREMARYSSSLLFSAPPKFSLEANQAALEELLEANTIEPFLQDRGEVVAVEGRQALRIIRDEEASAEPIITYADDDAVIWDVRHGKIVVGGVVVIEREVKGGDVYRMMEEHGPGYVTRKLFRGKSHYLGREVKLDELPEFAGQLPEEATGLNTATLVRWDNVPGGHSDLAGIETLLDRLDEGESLLVEKGRKSRPWLFTSRSFADDSGKVDISNLIFLEGGDGYLPDTNSPSRLVEAVQPELRSAEHIAWLEHVREYALSLSGYSLASWGLDKGGTADSGTALRLRQGRTLITREAKARMAKDAVVAAVSIALALKLGASDPRPLRPKLELGDGLPEDRLENAQELMNLTQAEAISLEEKVRRLNPGWSEEEIAEEVARIRGNSPGAAGAPIEEEAVDDNGALSATERIFQGLVNRSGR